MISQYNIYNTLSKYSDNIFSFLPSAKVKRFLKKKKKKAPAHVEQIQSSWSGIILLFTLFTAIIYPVIFNLSWSCSSVQGPYKRTPPPPCNTQQMSNGWVVAP